MLRTADELARRRAIEACDRAGQELVSTRRRMKAIKNGLRRFAAITARVITDRQPLCVSGFSSDV